MKITGIEIDWYIGWGNDPDIKIVVDEEPDWKNDFLFQKIKQNAFRGSTSYYYWAESPSGLLRAYLHKPWDQEGFGGSGFTLKMLDGTEETIYGPWDCGTGMANSLLEHDYFSVAIRSNRGLSATMINVDVLQPALLRADKRLELSVKGSQATELGDEQTDVILADEKFKPNTLRYYLKKSLKDVFPCEEKPGIWPRYISYFGERKD